jgi:hypothetical protein
MKNAKTRTQIADISVNGRELNEEHLRFVAGGLLRPTRILTYAPPSLSEVERIPIRDVYND